MPARLVGLLLTAAIGSTQATATPSTTPQRFEGSGIDLTRAVFFETSIPGALSLIWQIAKATQDGEKSDGSKSNPDQPERERPFNIFYLPVVLTLPLTPYFMASAYISARGEENKNGVFSKVATGWHGRFLPLGIERVIFVQYGVERGWYEYDPGNSGGGDRLTTSGIDHDFLVGAIGPFSGRRNEYMTAGIGLTRRFVARDTTWRTPGGETVDVAHSGWKPLIQLNMSL